MSMFVVGHGINSKAAFTTEEAANNHAAEIGSVEINGTNVQATVLEVPEGDYIIDKCSDIYPNGVFHHKKWNMQAEVLG
jgi:hypothetical protein